MLAYKKYGDFRDTIWANTYSAAFSYYCIQGECSLALAQKYAFAIAEQSIHEVFDNKELLDFKLL